MKERTGFTAVVSERVYILRPELFTVTTYALQVINKLNIQDQYISFGLSDPPSTHQDKLLCEISSQLDILFIIGNHKYGRTFSIPCQLAPL